MLKDKIYYHPNCKSRLKLKRLNGEIATLWKIDEDKMFYVKGGFKYKVIITNINNLCDESTWVKKQGNKTC